MTENELKQIITPFSLAPAKLTQVVNTLNKTFEWYSINTPLRVSHFLAQIIHECGVFKYMEELASGAAYEGRKDLGNTEKGDGVKYKGRGWLQLTGRANYTEAAKAFKQPFVEQPELVAQYPWVGLVSGYYWNTRKINSWADKDSLFNVSRMINRPAAKEEHQINGYEEREKWLAKAKKVLIK